MAGVSVQAFRRQGRRFGAGLVCSEMVSCAGIEHRNERTLGYLRVAADEHPLAIQLFGSDPRTMAEAARMVEPAGADLVDLNFGCPVEEGDEDGGRGGAARGPGRAASDRRAIVGAVAVPVSVKLRSGLRDGYRHVSGRRAAPRRGRRRVADVASAFGTADVHGERRARVDGRAGVARRRSSGRVGRRHVSRAKAQAVLATTGAAAVMVGRGAQGNPWALEEILDGTRASRAARRSLRSSCSSSARRCGNSASVGRPASSRSSTAVSRSGRFPRPFKQELVVLDSADEVERLLIAAAPGALALIDGSRRDP